MNRKAILAPILALNILLLASPILFMAISDHVGTESYVVLDTYISSVVIRGMHAWHLTWPKSSDPSFAGYKIYQSITQGELGTLIGTNTDIANTRLTVTGLCPWTTYYFTVRTLGANGYAVESGSYPIADGIRDRLTVTWLLRHNGFRP